MWDHQTKQRPDVPGPGLLRGRPAPGHAGKVGPTQSHSPRPAVLAAGSVCALHPHQAGDGGAAAVQHLWPGEERVCHRQCYSDPPHLVWDQETSVCFEAAATFFTVSSTEATLPIGLRRLSKSRVMFNSHWMFKYADDLKKPWAVSADVEPRETVIPCRDLKWYLCISYMKAEGVAMPHLMLLDVLVCRRFEGHIECPPGMSHPSFSINHGILEAVRPRLKDFHQLLLEPPKVQNTFPILW